MRPFFTLVAFLAMFNVVWSMSADKFPAKEGDIEITPITHASVQVEHAGTVIHVDPWHLGDYSKAKGADLILVTDDAGDHLDLEAIRNIRKAGAPIVIPKGAKNKIPDGTVLANGETKSVAGVGVEAVAAYDVTPGDPVHPKGEANGYIVTLGGRRVYFSGVTECVPEVRSVKNIDVAFLVMNLPKGMMTPAVAADCVKTFKPKVVYPYHYRTGNVQAFRDALKGGPIDVRLAEWYPNPVAAKESGPGWLPR